MTGNGRVVLEGVDRYQVMDALFEGVRVVLSYRGEPHSPAYVQGISGAAFRIGGICPCAPTCTAAMETQDLPALFGYEVTYTPLYEEGIDLDVEGAKVIDRIKDEIRAGRPALLWHAFTHAEWDVVAGFDEASGQLLGRGSYAGRDEYATADQMRTTTCLDICPCIGAILIGTKTGTFNGREAELAALREAVAHAHVTKDTALLEEEEWVFLDGLQCYDRWVADFRAATPKKPDMGDRYCFGVYRSTHRAAAGFLQELAETYPDAASALDGAAEHFVAEADLLNQSAELLFPGWQLPPEADPVPNGQVARWLQEARDAYAAGIEGIEAVLRTIG